jgi:hypothetical protein
MATHDQEKAHAMGFEGVDESDTSSQNYDARINAFTPQEQRKIVRRIDRRLVLTLAFMYCVSLMDRTNLYVRHFTVVVASPPPVLISLIVASPLLLAWAST